MSIWQIMSVLLVGRPPGKPPKLDPNIPDKAKQEHRHDRTRAQIRALANRRPQDRFERHPQSSAGPSSHPRRRGIISLLADSDD